MACDGVHFLHCSTLRHQPRSLNGAVLSAHTAEVWPMPAQALPERFLAGWMANTGQAPLLPEI